MKNKFIIDKEIDLNESDFLNTKIYSSNLSKTIKNTDLGKVFTIGLFGKWGSGKSSIIKTTIKQIEGENETAEIQRTFVKYDAWQYVNDSFRRMFLIELSNQLKSDSEKIKKNFYTIESNDIDIKHKLSPIYSKILLISVFIGIYILFSLKFTYDNKTSLFSIIQFLTLISTIVVSLLYNLKISISKPYLFAPEQFEEIFKKIVSKSFSNRKDKTKCLNQLVIVIDNIDRCTNEVAYNLLSDIKTFISPLDYNLIFIIPVDDVAVKNHIIKGSKNEDDCNNEKEEFLRKFFNVTIRIKPYDVTDMYTFAKEICKKHKLNFKPDTINLVSKEYATNPRRIIQLFNNLSSELNNYDDDFVQQHESLICCLLIIKEEYPKYYNLLLESPIKFKVEYSKLVEKDNIEKSNLERFIRIAHSYFWYTNDSILNTILFNSHHQFNYLDINIKNSVNSFDHKTIINDWESNKTNISDYIIDRMQNSRKNNLIDKELVSLFDFLLEISSKYKLDIYFTKRIDENILPHINNIIVHTKKYDNLCKYAILRAEQNSKILKDLLISNCIRSDQYRDDKLNNQFKVVLTNFRDTNSSKMLSSSFTNYGPTKIDELLSYSFSEDQINHLFTDIYISRRIADINTTNHFATKFNTDSNEYKILLWIFERKNNIPSNIYNQLFEHLLGERTFRLVLHNKSNEEIAKILSFINPIIKLIPDKQEQLSNAYTFYKLIFSDRTISVEVLSLKKSHKMESNFIDECISQNIYISEITDFVINMFRINDKLFDMRAEFSKLYKHIDLNERLLELKNKGFSLQAFTTIIFDNNNDYSKSSTYIMLEFCLNEKINDEEYCIDEKRAIDKIDALLNYGFEFKSNEVYSLISKLTLQERYIRIIKTILQLKEVKNINSLPIPILKSIYSK